MRAAVVSDIHGNWEALEAVWQDIQAARAEVVYCLGDVVGYGADPLACWHWAKQHCRVIVLGNHEAALETGGLQDRMNEHALAAIRWTAGCLSPAEINELKSLPLVYSGADARLVHATPDNPLSFGYVRSRLDVENAFRAFGETLCLIGHTHVPMVMEEIVPGAFRGLQPGAIRLQPKHRYLVNVGSVGQPRDGNPKARWVLIDSEQGRLDFHQVDYDISTAQKKIRAAGLPDFLADRLSRGS